jgi:hypothetical protein
MNFSVLSPSLNPSHQGREVKLLPLGGRPGGGEIKREKSSAFFLVIVPVYFLRQMPILMLTMVVDHGKD